MIRWTKSKKAATLLAVAQGRTTLAELEAEHGITAAELAEWRSLFALAGPDGLRATRAQFYHRQMQPGRRGRPKLRLVKG